MIPHIKPEFNWVDKSSLLIPRDGATGYQRVITDLGAAVSGSGGNFRRIKRQFSWTLFGALLCVRRHNGDLVVFDGGHRLDAVRDMDSISAVPCLIYRIEDIRQEAEVFRAINKWRTGLLLADDHRAAVIQGDATALNIQTAINKLGRTASRYASPTTISCISSLRKIFAHDAQRAAGVVQLAGEMCAGEPLDKYTIDALFFIENRLADKNSGESLLDGYRQALLNVGGGVISAAIKRERAKIGDSASSPGRTERWARAAVDAINDFSRLDIKLDKRGRGRPRKQSLTRSVEIKSQVGRRGFNGGAPAAA